MATTSGVESDECAPDTSAMVALGEGRCVMMGTDQRFANVIFAPSSQLFGRIFNTDCSVDQDTFDLSQWPDYISTVQQDVLSEGRGAVRSDTGYQSGPAYPQIIPLRLGAVILTGTNFANQFQGNSLADTIQGDAGKDKIAGVAGDDLLGERSKADNLIGRDGIDTLACGADNDTLLTGDLCLGSFVIVAASGNERVTDFKAGQDRPNLGAFHFATAAKARSQISQGTAGAELTLGFDPILLLRNRPIGSAIQAAAARFPTGFQFQGNNSSMRVIL